MRILHRFAVDPRIDHLAQWLRQNGFSKQLGDLVLEIDQDDLRYRELVRDFQTGLSLITSRVVFEKSEVINAKHATMYVRWMNGYPQPEDGFGYLEASYDLTDYCAECGVGARQVSPIMVRREPIWKQRMFMGINWLPDVVIVRLDVFESVFRPYCSEGFPLLTFRDRQPIESAVQLSNLPSIEIDTTELVGITCARCARIRYNFDILNFEPSPKRRVEGIAISDIWFGTGASAFRKVYVGQSLLEKLIDCRDRSLVLTPCAG